MSQKCSLILNDGSRFEGRLLGAPLTASGEMVFTTGMVGYSEAITDPSYFGQILCFTYPLIGNYGIPSRAEDRFPLLPQGFESRRPQTAAVIITIDSSEAFHWNSFQSLDSWLRDHGVPGIVGIDTRHLVHMIRSTPNLLGRLEPQEICGDRFDDTPFAGMGKPFFDPNTRNVVAAVSTKERYRVGRGSKRVALVDCGVKWNIVRHLMELDCEVEILPWDADLKSVDCSGWLLSNGPGNPKNTDGLIERVSYLLDQDRPILGICLGHQLLSLACGAATYRMEYGHRGHNQPVYQKGTRRGFITTQNHGYVVDEHSIPADWEAWFLNINDQTVEGLRHKSKPFRSVQFHPEAAGGPRDTFWIMEQFVMELKG